MPNRLFSSGIRSLLLFALLFLALGAIPSSAARAQFSAPRGEFTTSECDFDIPAGFQAGTNIVCGYLTVPEDHANPEGEQMDLSVVIIKSRAENPFPDPLFLAQGGPGGSTIATFGLLLSTDNPFEDTRDIVLWDQRGTKYADTELRCEEFVAATVATLDQVLSDEEESQISLETINRCRERFTGMEIDLDLYNSRQNAADAEALRVALGYDQINFYGVSYGSLLGFYLMDAYPQGLRSVILDAVVLPQENFLLTVGQNMDRSFNRLFEACAQSESCSSSYPDLQNTFYSLVDQLNQEPAEITIANPQTQTIYPALLDGDLFLTAIFQLLYPTEYIAFLPKIINDAADGDFSFLANAILPLLLFDDTVADGMYFSVICAENMDYTADDYQLDGLPPQISTAEKRDLVLLQEMCQVWGVESLPNRLESSGSSELPVLLLSGGFDPITPPQNAAQAAAGLVNEFSIVFPAGGHGQLLSGECQNNIVLDFLADPQQEPDSRCISAEVDFIANGDILPLSISNTLFGTDINALFRDLFWLGLVVFSLLGLFTAVIAYPVHGLYQRIKSKRETPLQSAEGIPDDPAQKRRFLFRLAPWLVLFSALTLLVFLVLVISTTTALVLENNPIIFYGFPRSNWLLFVLPFILLGLGLLIAVTAILRWIDRDGSVVGRVLYTLLAFILFIGLLGLSQLGMFGALIKG